MAPRTGRTGIGDPVTEEAAPGPDSGPPTYTCTFGVYNQDTVWSDVRSLTWADLTDLLTQHAVGAKEGSCLAACRT